MKRMSEIQKGIARYMCHELKNYTLVSKKMLDDGTYTAVWKDNECGHNVDVSIDQEGNAVIDGNYGDSEYWKDLVYGRR